MGKLSLHRKNFDFPLWLAFRKVGTCMNTQNSKDKFIISEKIFIGRINLSLIDEMNNAYDHPIGMSIFCQYFLAKYIRFGWKFFFFRSSFSSLNG